MCCRNVEMEIISPVKVRHAPFFVHPYLFSASIEKTQKLIKDNEEKLNVILTVDLKLDQTNVSIEILVAQLKIQKKSLHSNDVDRRVDYIEIDV